MGSWSIIIKRRNIDFSKGQVLLFKYAEPFACQYLYVGYLDNNNATCYDGVTKIRLARRLYGSPIGGKSEFSHFYRMHIV